MLQNTLLRTSNAIRSLVLLFVLLGCQDENIVGTNHGDIVGFVSLVDELGAKIQDAGNVKVSLDADHSTMSNSDGRFEFKDIEAGTYHIVYEKAGFGTTKKFNYIFTAGKVPGVIEYVSLVGLP